MADTLDVITLAEAKADIGDPGNDTLLASYITAVSRLLDKVCGPIVRRAVVDEDHDGNGQTTLSLAEWPVFNISSCVEYQGTTAVTLTEETVDTAPGQGFWCDFAKGQVHRRSGKRDWAFYPGRHNIRFNYVAGRYADTASVDQRFKTAALITLRNLWSKEQGMGTVTFGPDGQPVTGATFALPNAAAAFIREDIRISGHSD